MISNNADSIHSVNVEKTNLSDHDMVITHILNDQLTRGQSEEYIPHTGFDKLNYNKAKWEDMRAELAQTNWQTLLANKDVNEMCTIFNDTVSVIASHHCPEHIIRSTKPTIPRERRSLMRTRRHIISNINFLKYVKPTHTEMETKDRDKKISKLQTKQMEVEEKIKQSLQDEAQRKEDEAISKIIQNPKAFYSYANRKRKHKSNIGPFQTLQSDAKKMADILQQQLCIKL